jgi:hypothetical protein
MNLQLLIRFAAGCFFAVVLVFASIQFYSEPVPPSTWLFHGIYHWLHGENPHAEPHRPFPAGEYVYEQSETIQPQTDGPKFLARVTSMQFGEETTEVSITFDSTTGQDLPPITSLAPHATIHVADAILPVRTIATPVRTASEMQCKFEFAPLRGLRDTDLSLYFDEQRPRTFLLNNPTPFDYHWDETGTNIWWILGFVSLVGLVWVRPWKGHKTSKLRDKLLADWKPLDSERQAANATINEDSDAEGRTQRLRAADAFLNRAERILAEFHEENFKAPLRTAWVCTAFLFLFLLFVIALVPIFTTVHVLHPGEYQSDQGNITEGIRERVGLLERAHGTTHLFLLLAVAVGFVGILSNWASSVWRAQSTARKRIRGRFDEYETSLHERLARLDLPQDKLDQMERKIESLREQLETIRFDACDELRHGVEAISTTVSTSVATLHAFGQTIQATTRPGNNPGSDSEKGASS